MKDFIKRLTSRKFLLTLAAALTFYANEQYTELAAVILAYIGVNGVADATQRYANNKYAVPAKVEQQTQLIASGDLGTDSGPTVIIPGQH